MNHYPGDWRLIPGAEMNYYDPLTYYGYYPPPHLPLPLHYAESELTNVYVPNPVHLVGEHINGSFESERNPPLPREPYIPAVIKKEKIEKDFDEAYDREVNQLLNDIEDEFLTKGALEKIIKLDELPDIKSNDFLEEFSDQTSEDEEVPEWYEQVLKGKIRETRNRLSDLSNFLCYSCAATRDYLIRTETDHNTPFCKLNPPKHKSLRKTWVNKWKFTCNVKCKEEIPSPSHAHTIECQVTVLEHQHTQITRKTPNLLESEFPRFIMRVIESIEDFINKFAPDPGAILEEGEVVEVGYETPVWNWVQLRSNYRNEVMLLFCGKNIQGLFNNLRDYFTTGPRKKLRVVSLFCINNKWSTKKTQFPPEYVCGSAHLIDKVGSILVKYTPKNLPWFNLVEAELLGKAIDEYLKPTPDTTILDIGCGTGVIANMLAPKCDKVIGLTSADCEVKAAEEISAFNKIYNATFILCKPSDVQTKTSALIKNCISVAIMKQDTVFGKCYETIRALRNMPTLWRVILFGNYKKEFQKFVATLVNRDDYLGEPFLPIQGCIIDKAAKSSDDFEVVILFERKSLIESGGKAVASIQVESMRRPIRPQLSDVRKVNEDSKKTIESTNKNLKSIKSEIIDLDDVHSNSIVVKNPVHQFSSSPKIKKEPDDDIFYDDKYFETRGANLKVEPMDLAASPISDTDDILTDDLQNAVTPKHNPFSTNIPAESPDGKSINDLGFKLKPHESFLSFAKVKDNKDKKDDLRDLLEKKKMLQKEVGEQKKSRKDKDRESKSDRHRRDDKESSRKRRSRSPSHSNYKHHHKSSPSSKKDEKEKKEKTKSSPDLINKNR